MGRPDAIKVVDRCLEERHVPGQHLSVPGARGQSRVRTAPGQERVVVCMCVVIHVHVHVPAFIWPCTCTCTCTFILICSLIVFGSETVVPHCLMDSGLESGQSGSQDMGTGE